MHGDNIKNVRNFYMYLNNGAGGYIVYRKSGRVTYGVGISSNITRASLRGIFSAVNRLFGDAE